MKHKDALIKAGYTPFEISDAVFEKFDVFGMVSKEPGKINLFAAIAITSEENDPGNEMPMMSKELVKEIAYTADTLITDYGLEVHSYDMKNTEPFKNLKVIKLSNL